MTYKLPMKDGKPDYDKCTDHIFQLMEGYCEEYAETDVTWVDVCEAIANHARSEEREKIVREIAWMSKEPQSTIPTMTKSATTDMCHEVMTLRDYFAGQALAAKKWPDFFVGEAETEQSLRDHAEAAYQIADAMLALR